MTSSNAVNDKALAVDVDASEEYSGPMIDLSAMKHAVRRHRKFLIGAAFAGLIIGAAFHLVVPAKYAATTTLYMVEPSGGDPTQEMANDLSLLQTPSVAESAAAALHLNVNPAAFLTTYQGTVVSNVILSIKLSAASQAKAVEYDNAVANAFLALRSRELALQTKLVVDGLQSQVNSINSDVESLTGQINSLSAGKAGQTSASEIAQLVNQRSGDASQISQLDSQEQQDTLAERAVVDGSQVLDPAQAVKVSPHKAEATDAITGLVGALLLSLGIVMVGAVISDRPRLRSEVAAALGVPVELSLGRYNSPRLAHKIRLRRRLGRSSAALGLVERKLRANLEVAFGSALAVVPIGSVEVAALATASLGCSLASEGKRVVLADMIDGHPLPDLLGCKVAPGSALTIAVNGGELTLVVPPYDPGAMVVEGLEEADAVLVLAEVSPVFGADHIASWARRAVVFVTSGEVSATRLESSAEILRQAGIRVPSAVLIGTSSTDETAGFSSEEWAPSPPARRADNGDGHGELTTELRVENGIGGLATSAPTIRPAR
jgi:capsular polysaccharide biosynthesis protein